MLCPNCHSQTTTFAGKNIKKEKKKYHCIECSAEVSRSSTGHCVVCSNREKAHRSRKVKNRPSKEQILQDIKLLKYVGTAEKYGVSGNTVRNWLK